jgi:hypothetical protein
MSAPDDTTQPGETGEPKRDMGFNTPFGVFESVDDLTPEARAFMVQVLHTAVMPPKLRAALAAALGEAIPDGLDTTEEPIEHGAHADGCTCAEIHRENVWEMLDTAFPTDPHLWRAGEALFTLSAVNPTEASLRTRRAALEDATLHLQHSSMKLGAAKSPFEQLIDDFRDQLDGK